MTFTGSIDRYEEVIARVKRAKLFVHPSTKEGGGSITLLEANACGLPAIVVRHPMGVDPSLVQDGRNGFWAEDLSPPAIAAVIERCLDDVGLLGSMRFASVAFAAESDWSEIAKATAKVYERFAPPAPKPAATAIPASIDSVNSNPPAGFSGLSRSSPRSSMERSATASPRSPSRWLCFSSRAAC